MVRVKHSLLVFGVLASLSISMFVQAQMKSGQSQLSCSIRGQVRYEDGRVADHIVVRLRSDTVAFQTEATTDPQGKFDFAGLGPTRYRLTIEGQGVRPYESVLDVSMSHMAYKQITLKFVKAPNASIVPPEGPGSSLDADVPKAARKEYEEGQKSVNEKKDADSGISHYRKAIQIYDKYTEAHLALGLLYLDLRKFDEAQASLQKANVLTPNAPGPYLAMGTMYNLEKKFDDAEKVLKHALELKPDIPEGQYELAKTYWATGKWEDSEPHAQKAASLAPHMAPVHVLLGNIALRKQDPTGALKEFQQYLTLDPKGPMAGGVSQMIQKIEASQKK
jgi:cytochrome c-type biogenesis protein CcmH/NrfG